MPLPADYQARAQQYNFASAEEVKQAMAQPDTYVLDVRTPEEITAGAKVEHANWKQTNCTPEDCPALSMNPEEFVPNKDATVVVYCRSGRRASRAKEILQEKGYTGKIYNAGGVDDLLAVLES